MRLIRLISQKRLAELTDNDRALGGGWEEASRP
jgi:hypothetical protein